MKHGFLILLHNNYEQVRKLITLFDKEDSYIFLHVDKKSKLTDKDISLFFQSAQIAHIILVDRVSVQWGGYSQIQATMSLFKEAIKYDLDYYHLISGADMPLKSWKELDAFFEKNKGVQFVSYVPDTYQKSLQKRIKYYWLFQEIIGNPKQVIQQKSIYKIFLLCVQRVFVFIQMLMKVDRRKKNEGIIFTIGSNWVSITKGFLDYIVHNEQWIRKTFNHTLCSDEVFVTTLLSNSLFSKKVQPNQRYIDWGRGNPYVFRASDYNELVSSGKIFARKFDQNVDSQIIEAIFATMTK